MSTENMHVKIFTTNRITKKYYAKFIYIFVFIFSNFFDIGGRKCFILNIIPFLLKIQKIIRMMIYFLISEIFYITRKF